MRKQFIGRLLNARLFVIGFLGALPFALCAFAQAQQGKIYRVGVLVVGGAEIAQIKGLRDGLKELGYTQGKNLALEVSDKETYEEYAPIVKRYKENKPDMIVTIGVAQPASSKKSRRRFPQCSTSAQIQCRPDSSNLSHAPRRILLALQLTPILTLKVSDWKFSTTLCPP